MAYNWPKQNGPHLQSQHSGGRNERVIANSRLILVNRLPPEQLKATDPQSSVSINKWETKWGGALSKEAPSLLAANYAEL